MADAVWVGAFTGATAILASWITTRGNARAARVQAEASAQAQRHVHVREVRRAAYLDLMEQAHLTGQLYWRVEDAYVQLAGDARLVRINELRDQLRTAFDLMMRCTRIVVLEGPLAVATAAEAVQDAAQEANRALWRVTCGDPNARERFKDSERSFKQRLKEFNKAAQTVMSSL